MAVVIQAIRDFLERCPGIAKAGDDRLYGLIDGPRFRVPLRLGRKPTLHRSGPACLFPALPVARTM